MTTTHRLNIEPAHAHVLVIEDNASNNTTLQRLLTFAGVPSHQCDTRFSGSGAVQFAESRSERIDLVLLDLVLPEQSGYDVLKELRSSPSFEGTRIVAVTGHNSVEEIRRTRAAGFDGFLGKPLLAERFVSQLARILKGEPVWER